MKVYCVFSLKSPHRYTIFNIKKNITMNYPISAAMVFFQGTQERVRSSHGKRAISARAIEVLLYIKASEAFYWFHGCNVGWLVGCFGFNGPLRQYFSLYRAVSQREGARGEKG